MRVAVAQLEPQLGAKERNLEACLARLDEAATAGAELLVLPECAIPGYMFDSGEEAMPYAEEIPGPATEVLERESARLGLYVVCGRDVACVGAGGGSASSEGGAGGRDDCRPRPRPACA